MTAAQPLSWPTSPVAYGPVVLRAFSSADLPMVQEMSADPYVPLIGTLPLNASAREAQEGRRPPERSRRLLRPWRPWR